jgi:ubiquinone/menaquinone biosynthesis C-methylase UbiE
MHILDVGYGIGGPSRTIAEGCGCRVIGIDLTEEFVRTAAALAGRVGLAGRVTYRQASALALPFEPDAFDGAYMLHVGMNISDKSGLFSEVRRVLKPGSWFAIFDAMRTGEGELSFPLHWAATREMSFVASPEEYRCALDAAGFELIKERNRSDFTRGVFHEAQARAAASSGTPLLGIHILMKTDVPQKLANVTNAVDRGPITPIEPICRAQSLARSRAAEACRKP